MLSAPTQEHAPASYSYEPTRQLLQTLFTQYDPIDCFNAQHLAQRLRSIAEQLDAASGTVAPAERLIRDDAKHSNPSGLDSMEKSWAAGSSEHGASGVLSRLAMLTSTAHAEQQLLIAEMTCRFLPPFKASQEGER